MSDLISYFLLRFTVSPPTLREGVEGDVKGPEIPDVSGFSTDLPSLGGDAGAAAGLGVDLSAPSVDVDVPSVNVSGEFLLGRHDVYIALLSTQGMLYDL